MKKKTTPIPETYGIRRNVEQIRHDDPLCATLEAAIAECEETSDFMENGGDIYISASAETGLFEITITPQTDWSRHGTVHALVYTIPKTAVEFEMPRVKKVLAAMYAHIEGLQAI